MPESRRPALHPARFPLTGEGTSPQDGSFLFQQINR